MANSNDVTVARKAKHGGLLTIFMTVVSLAWIAPIFIVVLNSFKKKAFIFRYPFSISEKSITEGWDKFAAGAERMFAGMLNYSNAIAKTKFWQSFGYSAYITVVSVALIVLLCSMCAWYVVRVHSTMSKMMYLLFLFSMIVPFQMVMFTLSKFANMLKLSTPVGIVVVYLGFGAGLSVFMFTGFIKGISIEIEEAAMIDGCNPIQTFFKIIFPILKPTTITVAILQAMWIWNDYLLPSLVLNINKYKTIPIAVQFLKQSHGQVDWGAMMAVLVLAILPIVVFYLICQKYIIEGVMAGAVKG